MWEYEDIPAEDDGSVLLIVLKDRNAKSHIVGIASFEYKPDILVLSKMGMKLYKSIGFKEVKKDVLTDKQREAIVGGMDENISDFGTIMSKRIR